MRGLLERPIKQYASLRFAIHYAMPRHATLRHAMPHYATLCHAILHYTLRTCVHTRIYRDTNETENLRNYLLGGGFLHIDDNYGMDAFVRTEISKVFPETDLIELPTNHPIFYGKYKFKNGLPKIHEHDASPSQAFGIVVDGRLVLLYTFESDIGDGWEDAEVHNDSEETRLKALQMGCNILEYILKN